eukprot:CAMPEP_0119340460 /NCGR_PEP_ID=MMETSP1333-20130426/100417_1 /TAXON_ID=418940 /ORGANISM="Scyphosphaera apsteinii, Strain RCC1455" /LENGTH=155 /DNA_ID=CAMNT_0007352215 /DNA_START=149 /DNA_END=616 /DNA_ORIENTATION=+
MHSVEACKAVWLHEPLGSYSSSSRTASEVAANAAAVAAAASGVDSCFRGAPPFATPCAHRSNVECAIESETVNPQPNLKNGTAKPTEALAPSTGSLPSRSLMMCQCLARCSSRESSVSKTRPTFAFSDIMPDMLAELCSGWGALAACTAMEQVSV